MEYGIVIAWIARYWVEGSDHTFPVCGGKNEEI